MYYITQPGISFAYTEKTLGKFAAKQARTAPDGTEYSVYRSKAAFREGFDFTNYELRNGKLKKSNAQPIVELNRLLLGG
jgi:hypothetical protein